MNRNQRIALAEKDLKIKDLAFKLDLHAGYVSNILGGRYEVPQTRSRIAKILGKDEAYLWPKVSTEK